MSTQGLVSTSCPWGMGCRSRPLFYGYGNGWGGEGRGGGWIVYLYGDTPHRIITCICIGRDNNRILQCKLASYYASNLFQTSGITMGNTPASIANVDMKKKTRAQKNLATKLFLRENHRLLKKKCEMAHIDHKLEIMRQEIEKLSWMHTTCVKSYICKSACIINRELLQMHGGIQALIFVRLFSGHKRMCRGRMGWSQKRNASLDMVWCSAFYVLNLDVWCGRVMHI